MVQHLTHLSRLKVSLNRYRLRLKDTLFLALPILFVMASIFLSNKIYSILMDRYLSNIKLVDTSFLESLRNLSSKPPFENIQTEALISSLKIREVPTQDFPPMPPLKDMGLTKIPPPGGHVSQGLEATKLDLKLQAVYISDKSKFAIINGKIYKENTFDDILKILKIVEGRVFIELHTKERRWLNLN